MKVSTIVTKKEILEILDKEVLNLKGLYFFDVDHRSSIYKTTLEQRELIDASQEEIDNCKVCAVGAILRNKFKLDEMINNRLLTKAVGDRYCCDNVFYPLIFEVNTKGSDRSINTLYRDILSDDVITENIGNKMFLAALSCFFEEVIFVNDKKILLGLLDRFIIEMFPEEIEI